MTAPSAWPAGISEAARGHDGRAGEPAPPALAPPAQALPAQALQEQEAAHVVIGDMAGLLRDNRGSVIADGCILGGVTIGLALETGLAARLPGPGLTGLIDLGLLCGTLVCWLAAVSVLVWAGRPVLNRVSELRWVTGAPLDPRAGWVTLPPAGADPAEWTWNRAYLLVGAARLARYRIQYADTWTYLAGGFFLAWTAVLILAR